MIESLSAVVTTDAALLWCRRCKTPFVNDRPSCDCLEGSTLSKVAEPEEPDAEDEDEMSIVLLHERIICGRHLVVSCPGCGGDLNLVDSVVSRTLLPGCPVRCERCRCYHYIESVEYIPIVRLSKGLGPTSRIGGE